MSAELLSIMVEPALRSRGIGAQLLDALAAECRTRHIAYLDVTVDASNEGAQRFYRRHGFALHHRFTLYGREMVSLRRDLWSGEAVK
jgi:ribosomal protein S18 acetylase RimI-like enzyme